MIEDTFLAVNKKYLGTILKSIDILIVAQIDEFQRNHCECYLTNKQLSELSGESEDTIKRSLNKLEKLNIIKRNTTFIDGNGKANRRRVLILNNIEKWKDHIAPTKMDGANLNDGRCKNDEWKVHNAPIKDNIKEKKKDNILETKEILSLISFDKEIQEDIEYGLGCPEDYMIDNFYSFVSEEFDRLGRDITFIVFYDAIKSYKDGKCMGTCLAVS